MHAHRTGITSNFWLPACFDLLNQREELHIPVTYRYQKIAFNLSISVGTAYNIFKLVEATREVDHKSQPKREGKLDNHHELLHYWDDT